MYSNRRKSIYSSAGCRPSSSRNSPPPPDICAQINGQVHSNPALGSVTFDFAAHVQNRSYVMRNFAVGDSEVAGLLDAGVDDLLPDVFEPVRPAPSDMYKIDKAGKSGIGMFASRDIQAGSLILAEHPVVISPYLLGLPTPLSDLYAKLFNRLPPQAFHDVMNLANSTSEEECGLPEGIIRTNAIGIQLDVPDVPHPELAIHRAIFVNTSRCNHSCGPNAKWEWDRASFSLYLSAVRPILSGEEITIQYTTLTRPRQERRETLRSLYGFACSCEYCHLPTTDDVNFSDSARITLNNFWGSLPAFEQWCLDASMPDETLINLHTDALELMKQEGLQVLDCEKHIDAIAMCYGALEDVDMFRAWIGRVRSVKIREKPSQAIVFAKWLSNPTTFPAWGWRKTFCGSRAVS